MVIVHRPLEQLPLNNADIHPISPLQSNDVASLQSTMAAPETTPARTSEDGSVTHTMKTNSTTDAPSKTSSSIGILRSTRHRRSEDASDSVDPPPSLTSNNPTISEKEQKEEDKRVCILRSAMIATLLSATVVVASLTYVFVHRSEEQTFVNQYRDSVAKVAEAFQAGLNSKRDVAQTFSAIYTSRYGNDAQDPSVWPNATMPDFQQQAEAQLRLSNGRAMSFNPIITQDVDRLDWEAHAEESAWILGSPQLIEPEEGTEWPDNRTVSFGIYSRDADKNVIYDPGYAEASVYPSVLVPVWQIAPIVTNEKAVMFNLHSEPNRMRALDDMLTYRLTTLTAILQLVQDVELRPSAILFYPVFDEFNSDIDNIDKNVVGSISVVFSWDDLLKKILPNYIKGMICVLKSSIDQTYTYSISGDRVTLLGEGDQHDAKYDDMGVTAEADLSETDEALGVVNYLITYTLTMYPSQEFEDQYVTNKAIIYTVGVVLIFLCTAGLFLLYDYLVENRQQKTARLARQTSTIVDSMFPAAFRDRYVWIVSILMCFCGWMARILTCTVLCVSLDCTRATLPLRLLVDRVQGLRLTEVASLAEAPIKVVDTASRRRILLVPPILLAASSGRVSVSVRDPSRH